MYIYINIYKKKKNNQTVTSQREIGYVQRVRNIIVNYLRLRSLCPQNEKNSNVKYHVDG